MDKSVATNVNTSRLGTTELDEADVKYLDQHERPHSREQQELQHQQRQRKQGQREQRQQQKQPNPQKQPQQEQQQQRPHHHERQKQLVQRRDSGNEDDVSMLYFVSESSLSDEAETSASVDAKKQLLHSREDDSDHCKDDDYFLPDSVPVPPPVRLPKIVTANGIENATATATANVAAAPIQKRHSAASASSSSAAYRIPSPTIPVTHQNFQANATIQDSGSTGEKNLSSWDSPLHPNLQNAVVFHFSSEDPAPLKTRPANSCSSVTRASQPEKHPIKRPLQQTSTPSLEGLVHTSAAQPSHAKQQVYPLSQLQQQPQPQSQPQKREPLRPKHRRMPFNEEKISLTPPFEHVQNEARQKNSDYSGLDREIKTSNSSSSVSTEEKELSDQFIQQLRITSTGAFQESEGELNTSLDESYAGPDDMEFGAIIRHDSNSNPTNAASCADASTHDGMDSFPLHRRLSSMDTHLIENISPELRVANAVSLAERPNMMDDTFNMTLSESEEGEEDCQKDNNNSKRSYGIKKNGGNKSEGKDYVYGDCHSNHSNTDDETSRPLDWEQQNSADDEKTANDEGSDERIPWIRKYPSGCDNMVPGHRRRQSADGVAVLLSMGAGTNWRGMERDQIPLPEQDDDEESYLTNGSAFPFSPGRAQFSVGSSVPNAGQSGLGRTTRWLRREQRDRQKQKHKQKQNKKRASNISHGDDVESPVEGSDTSSAVHGATGHVEQFSPGIEFFSQAQDGASQFPHWLPKHDVQFLQNATKQVELSPGLNLNFESYSPNNEKEIKNEFKVEDTFSSSDSEGYVQKHRIHLQTKDMTLEQVESQMRQQCVHDHAVLHSRDTFAYKFDRSVFLPTTTVVGMKEIATYICPRCKTRQREFFTTKNAPHQYESGSGYLALCLAIYVIASLYIFGMAEGWPALDCIYFAVCTLTTAGLGDLVPTSDGNKIICSIFIYVGVACIGLLLGSYIGGKLDEISTQEARENRLKSCPNCARLKNMKDTAERRQLSLTTFGDHISQSDGSFVGRTPRGSFFLSDRPDSDLSKSGSIYNPELRQNFKRRKSERNQKYDHVQSKLVLPEVPARKMQNVEYNPPSNKLEKTFLDGSVEKSPSGFVDSSPAMNSHNNTTEITPVANSKDTINGFAPLDVIDSYGTGTRLHGGTFSPVDAPLLPVSRQSEFLASPMTRKILSRQSHTRHFSFDMNNSSAGTSKSFHESIRKLSVDAPVSQQTPTIRETEDEAELSERWTFYDMSVEEESCSSDSSISRTSLETEQKMNQVQTARYVFVTLKQALMKSIGIIFVGCMGFCLIERFSFVDSWYFTTVLLTTVGYGDIVPVTKGGKLFATLYILVAGTILLNNMSMISMIPLELRKRRIERAVLTQFGDQLDDDALRELAAGPLIQELRMAVNRPDGLNECTREMFAIAMLVRLGKVTKDDVLQTFAAFRRLDVNNDGVLNSKSIIDGMIQKRRSKLQNTPAPTPAVSSVVGDRDMPYTQSSSYWLGNPPYNFKSEGGAYHPFHSQPSDPRSRSPTEKSSLLSGENHYASFDRQPSYPRNRYD